MPFRRKPREEPERHQVVGESSPELVLGVKLANLFDRAFGTDRMDDPDFSGVKLYESFRKASIYSKPGELYRGRVVLSTNDAETDGFLAALTHALGVELPDDGIVGLRSLVAGLREQGESRTLRPQPVTSGMHSMHSQKGIGEEDMIGFITEPTIIAVDSGREYLILPTAEENLWLRFSGTGLTHPDNQPENPLDVELLGMRPEES